MKHVAMLLILAACLPSFAQSAKPAPTLKSILLEQLRTTHNEKDWFVPANIAIEGLTPDQAKWTDGSGNHSIGQLTVHLIFWNSQQLAKMKGEPRPKYSGNNDETFNSFDAANWAAAVKQLDEVLTSLEKTVEGFDEAQMNKWATNIAHIAAHNAYHTGQIVYIRKLQGSWNPENGVK
jgi:uncharacterized damage-inducible protein DinB